MGNQRKPKCLFVATVVKTHINEFHLPYLQMFQSYGYETHVAARDDFALNGEICQIPYCDRFFPIPFERSPFSAENWRAYKMLKTLIAQENYDLIHCHTPVGGMIARLAARTARKKGTKVFYTAHGFHFFQGAPFGNWLLYYPAERLAARWTDVLITINQEDYQRAQKFPAQKVVYVPGVGVQMKKFANADVDFSIKRKELDLPPDAFVLLMTGELSKRKNQDAVLDVMARFKGSPVICLLCGQGILTRHLQEKARALGIEKQVRFLGFRYDLPEICAVSDLFLFPTWHEGLPVALMEAMTAGLPIVCSNVRGNRDLIEDGQGGYLTRPDDISAMEKAIRLLMADPEQRKKMGEWNRQAVLPYDLEQVREKMRLVYGFEAGNTAEHV